MKFNHYHLIAIAAGIAAAGQVFASPLATSIRNSEMSIQSAWTDADYANAKTLTPKVNFLPSAVFDYNAAVEAAGQASTDVRGGRGGAAAHRLFQTRSYASQAAADGSMEVMPDAVGTGGINFTSTRVFPNEADTAYPTRTVGKLYFKKPNGATYMCSGSMVKPGIVVTAGHCIHDGSGSFYNSFQFIPGYRKVAAVETRPYGTWTNWAYARTTTDWVTSGGSVPNKRDWAIIVFNTDRGGKRIGDYTGWLGYRYPAMIGKQASVLGYPGNLDSGGQMHLIASMVTNYGSLNNGTWGSDMEGGSSGGPVVLNFRKDFVNSSTLPSDDYSNRVTSVVSWGYISTAPKVQGGSQFDSVFGTMISETCAAYAFAC